MPTCRNGKTLEVMNTDAEGRLAMMEGPALAVEADVDAIVDIADFANLGGRFARCTTARCSWTSSSTASRGRTSTSQAPCPPMPTSRGDPPVPPATAPRLLATLAADFSS